MPVSVRTHAIRTNLLSLLQLVNPFSKVLHIQVGRKQEMLHHRPTLHNKKQNDDNTHSSTTHSLTPVHLAALSWPRCPRWTQLNSTPISMLTQVIGWRGANDLSSWSNNFFIYGLRLQKVICSQTSTYNKSRENGWKGCGKTVFHITGSQRMI